MNKGASTVTIEGKLTRGTEVERFKRVLTYPSNLNVETMTSKLSGQTLCLSAQKDSSLPSFERQNPPQEQKFFDDIDNHNFMDKFNQKAKSFFGHNVDAFQAPLFKSDQAVGIEERSRSPYFSQSPQVARKTTVPAPKVTNVQVTPVSLTLILWVIIYDL